MIGADDHQAAESEEQPLISEGDVVGGRYALTRIVGRGAAGTVWEAEHRLLTSKVAIKFLDTAALLDPTSAEILAQRFRFEAQISARMSSATKHLVSAHDAGMFRGIPYLVMELVSGETLDQRLSRGRMSVEDAAVMLDQLAEPIDSAHACGIAHRDIKPGNVMIVTTPSGPFYKLGDFGTAKAFGEGLVGLTPPKQTSENTLVGSPAYMSPEYISGLPLATGAIDLWALAVTLYEAITGKLPFDGEVWTQVAVAIVGGEFAPASSIVENLPPKVDEVLARAFSQEPNERYTNARHLARAFRVAIEPPAAVKPVVVDQPDTPMPVEVPARNPRRLWGVGAVALMLVLGLGVIIVAMKRGDGGSSARSENPAPTSANAANDAPTSRGRVADMPATASAATTADSTSGADNDSSATASANVDSDRTNGHKPVRSGRPESADPSTPAPPTTVVTAPVSPPAQPPRPKPSIDKSEIH